MEFPPIRPKVPHTLLLADDSVTIQRVIELTFADEDITVVAVGDGDQAIARMQTAPPDIVLADIGMPGKNGYEVAEYMKQSPALQRIPLLLLTGAFESVDVVRATAVHCDGVLSKPFEPQFVISRVKELLARAGHAEPTATDPLPHAIETQLIEHPSADGIDRPLDKRTDFGDSNLEAYFDRLDQAFADLSKGPEPQPTSAQGELRLPHVPDDEDWFASASTAPQFDKPILSASFGNASTPARSAEVSAAPLADAFAALLAAEQHAPEPSAAPAWPTQAPAATIVVDDLVEQVTERVLQRLTDRVVHEAVAEIVSAIAERLVREEIERTKAAIE